MEKIRDPKKRFNEMKTGDLLVFSWRGRRERRRVLNQTNDSAIVNFCGENTPIKSNQFIKFERR